MNIKNTLAEFFRVYGTQVNIEGYTCQGILTPRNETDGERSRMRMEELGAVRRGDWLLMVTPEAAELKPGIRLIADGMEYIVRAADLYCLSGEPLYRYAVLERPACSALA